MRLSGKTTVIARPISDQLHLSSYTGLLSLPSFSIFMTGAFGSLPVCDNPTKGYLPHEWCIGLSHKLIHTLSVNPTRTETILPCAVRLDTTPPLKMFIVSNKK